MFFFSSSLSTGIIFDFSTDTWNQIFEFYRNSYEWSFWWADESRFVHIQWGFFFFSFFAIVVVVVGWIVCHWFWFCDLFKWNLSFQFSCAVKQYQNHRQYTIFGSKGNCIVGKDQTNFSGFVMWHDRHTDFIPAPPRSVGVCCF